MRKLLTSLLMVIGSSLFSQNNNFNILSNEKVLGRNLLTDTEIKATEYIFPERIHETYIDTVSGLLTVQLRGLSKNGNRLDANGNILLYDLKAEKLKWTKEIAYRNSSLHQFSNTMLYSVGNKIYCLDINNGNELWEVKNSINFVEPALNIGIGYKNKIYGYSNDLEGINLNNGDILWTKEINREYGWNDIIYINDSSFLIVAAGLHTINIKNGNGWDYNTITGKKDTKVEIAGLINNKSMPAIEDYMIRDVVSNAYMDSTAMYLSSREQLAKIDKLKGNINWSNPFPKDLPSSSSIFIKDSILFLINKGYAFEGSRQIDFGKPFIAAYNKETGKQKFFTLIDAKDNLIRGYNFLNNEIYLVFKNRIAKYSKETGKLILEKEFPAEQYGDLTYTVGNHVYVTKGDDFYSLPQSDPTKLYLCNDKGKIFVIDSELNVIRRLYFADVYFFYLKTPKYNFIAKDKMTCLVNKEGRKVAEIEASKNSFLIGNTLYNMQNDRFFAFDLTDLLESK